MTNGERIRSMTDEELAEFLNGILSDCDYCPSGLFATKQHFQIAGKYVCNGLKAR